MSLLGHELGAAIHNMERWVLRSLKKSGGRIHLIYIQGLPYDVLKEYGEWRRQ
jgi:hypothetical protein